jgi:hypothetical protein
VLFRSRPDRAHEVDTCELLTAQLDEAWGTSIQSGLGAHWLAPAAGRRASLVGGERCSLVFDRFVPADKFITRSPDSVVPVWAVGQPAKKLTDARGEGGARVDGDRLEWDAPGVGASLGPTTVTAYIKHGKVVAITASANASSSGVEDVVDQISKVTKLDYTGEETRRWNSRPPIQIDSDHGVSLFVTVGAPQD